MRNQSGRARKISVERRKLRLGLLFARGPACQGCPVTPVGDDRTWTDLHEVLTRARGGDPTDLDNILCLCRECHAWVTTHEEQAQILGLVRGRTAGEHKRVFRPWDT